MRIKKRGGNLSVRGRRGQTGFTISMTLKMILIIVTLIIIVTLLPSLFTYAKNYAQGGVCQASAAASALKVETLCIDTVESPVALNCPRRHVEIGPTSATLTVKGKSTPIVVSGATTYDEANKEVVNGVFADELINCWRTFGSGESILFSQFGDKVGEFLSNSETACFIYSEIFFEDVDFTSTKDDWKEYITTTKEPKSGDYYIDILNNPNTICEETYRGSDNRCWTHLFDDFLVKKGVPDYPTHDNSLKIESGKSYAVVMMRKRFDICDSKSKKDPDASFTAQIFSQEDLNRVCDFIIT